MRGRANPATFGVWARNSESTGTVGSGNFLPKRVDPENLTPFGEVFWDIADKRGISGQSDAERYTERHGRRITQKNISRYTTKGEDSSRPTPKFARDLVVGLELDFREQVELAWAELYGERMPGTLMDRLEAFEDFYERFVGGREQSRSTSSTTTSETPETEG